MKRLAAALFLLLARPAAADVVLNGSQHLGDDVSASYSVPDPVTRTQYSVNPSHFELSDAIVVTAITLNGAVLEMTPAQFDFIVDGVNKTGTLSGGTWTPSASLSLSAGSHTIAPDAYCIKAGSATANCTTGNPSENDASWTSLTLVSTGTSLSQNFDQRRHLGDYTESPADQYGGTYYPDAPDGTSLTINFTLDRNRRLSTINLYRLRNVDTTNDVVSVDGTQVAALSGNGTPYTISPNVFLLAGSHTLQIVAGLVAPFNEDDYSWDDIALTLVNDPLQTPGRFNAVDTGSDAVSGVIQTKEAGTTFAVDLVALDSTSSALLSNYIGTVTVELLDASTTSGVTDGYGCDASWTTAASLGTADYTAADSGRKSFNITYNGALKIARIKQTDSVLGIAGCSADAFAIRPAYLGSATATDTDATTAGTTRTLDSLTAAGAKTHKAGQYFTLQVTGYTSGGAVAAGYNGSPTVTAQTSLLGSTAGTATASNWSGSGTLRSDIAQYFEAGAVRLLIDDTTFADVDLADTSAANREVVPTTVDAGRFIPDHFKASLNSPVFQPGCSDAFTYVGQPFGFRSGHEAEVTLTAVASDGTTTTTNYCDTLYKLPANADQSSYSAASGSVDTSGATVPDNAIANQCSSGNPGVSLLTINPGATGLKFARTTPAAPFTADIAITVGALNETDGVTWSGSAPAFGAATPNNGVLFDTGATLPSSSKKEVRFGRLVIDNAFGSELQPLDVPLRAEYYYNGWSTNGLDSCTTLPSANILLSSGITTIDAGGSALTLGSGVGKIRLTAPGVNGQVTLTTDTLAAAGLTWLLGDWNGDNSYSDEASGTATFGVYAPADNKRIFLREVVP